MANIKNRRLFTSYVSIKVIMSIVLLLFGFFGIFFISSNSIANSFKEDFSVSIFFKENAKKIEIIQLQNELLMSSYIQKLKYISKDDEELLIQFGIAHKKNDILELTSQGKNLKSELNLNIGTLKRIKNLSSDNEQLMNMLDQIKG